MLSSYVSSRAMMICKEAGRATITHPNQ